MMRAQSPQGMIRWLVTISFCLASPALAPVSVAEMGVEEAAAAFGTYPAFRGVHLSPDGQRIVALVQHKEDFPIAIVINLKGGKPKVILASDEKKKLDIQWCDWANDSRLLCAYYGVQKFRSDLIPVTRLVAVNADGSNIKTLTQRQQRDEYAFNQTEIADWLPDDREHILMLTRERNGRGVSRVNIYKDRIKSVEAARQGVWDWRTNGRGEVRLRRHFGDRKKKWQYRESVDGDWKTLHVDKNGDWKDRFWPLGFGDDPNLLFVLDEHEGRIALFSQNLAKSLERELVYAHPSVDIDNVVKGVGKFRRVAGASYITDIPHVEYFDPKVKSVQAQVRQKLPDVLITIAGESYDRRFYLIEAESDVVARTYYRFDASSGELGRITSVYPQLDGVELARMDAIQYPSDDGTMIPAYLSRSANDASGPRPAILLPHGGPSARDTWGFDWLPQFLAARGYVVLQSNYRGSDGYGAEWLGDGAFLGWKQAMTDIEYGARYLVEQGIADPDRICAVGWNFGGYAALMSAISSPDRHRCVVSIAGVADPVRMIDDSWGSARDYWKSMIGKDRVAIVESAPVKYADKIKAPVLLVHGDLDINVPVRHSKLMEKALQRANVETQYFEYEDIDHHFRKQKERVDMLMEMGNFLDEHLKPRAKTQTSD